jgi:hypothetical protein
VEAAGHLVAATAELAAGVEDGVDDLEGILTGRVPADWDTVSNEKSTSSNIWASASNVVRVPRR